LISRPSARGRKNHPIADRANVKIGNVFRVEMRIYVGASTLRKNWPSEKLCARKFSPAKFTLEL
jgi:hypothetical protein